MPSRTTHEAIVLRAVDVGEADRFCILLTKGAGRLAARAKGVRKPGSRMGGVLLPLRTVRIELVERGAGMLIVSAQDLAPTLPPDFTAFSRMQQGVEMLLMLTEEGSAMPDIFLLTRDFLMLCQDEEWNPLPLFTLRLLFLLGLLPANDDDPRFARMSDEAKQSVRECIREKHLHALRGKEGTGMLTFLRAVLVETLPRALKAREIR